MTEKRLDPMFTKNKRSIAAKERARKQKELNPDHFSKAGQKGGSVRGITKGFGSMDVEQHKKLSRDAINKRWGNEKAN